MPTRVFIVGVSCTRFGKWPERSFPDLTREVYLGLLNDAGLDDGPAVDSVWFGNSGMGAWGQTSIRGQVCFAPLVREGLFPERVPILNVENACATGSAALHAAAKDVRSGESRLVMAIGVEKLHFPGVAKEKVLAGFAAGLDNSTSAAWRAEYERLAESCGAPCVWGSDRTAFIDAGAVRARWHQHRYGTTLAQMAIACSKSHWYGARNPRAAYRFEVPMDSVLRDRVVSDPLRRAMCALPGDGAAAALLCGEDTLSDLPCVARDRAVELKASVLTGGKLRRIDEPSLTAVAAERAYRLAGISPADIDVAEVHDSTSFGEIEEVEMLGLCPIGEGGRFVESGATSPGGKVPVNTSGGLVSKTHPVGATGLAMTHELVTQLRGEAGERQVAGAEIALQHNAGGAIGLEDAVAAVAVLQRGP
jgi:acetyl-CoA acetyltransferase